MGFSINTNKIEKPTSTFDDTSLADGIYPVKIDTCEYAESSNGNWMLKLRYKTLKEGRFIFDQIMDDPTKSINAYRLSRLLAALGLTIKGEVELRDLPKIIKVGSQLKVAIHTKEGSAFTNIDINKHDGYYPINEETQKAETETPDLAIADTDIDEVEITDEDDSY